MNNIFNFPVINVGFYIVDTVAIVITLIYIFTYIYFNIFDTINNHTLFPINISFF